MVNCQQQLRDPGNFLVVGTPSASDASSQRSRRGTRTPLYFLAGAWLLAAWLVPAARAESSREYDLKAVLLFSLTRFVDWPPGALADPNAPLTIGILGQDPFGQTLDDVVRAEYFGPHKIRVVRCRTVESARSCQLLFVCSSEQPNLPRILRELAGRPVLTVGDFEGFATDGGMVRLFRNSEGKIRVRINLGSVRASGLAISGKLLRLAEIINAGTN